MYTDVGWGGIVRAISSPEQIKCVSAVPSCSDVAYKFKKFSSKLKLRSQEAKLLETKTIVHECISL